MTDAWTQTDPEPLLFEGQYVTDADYPRRLARAFVSLALSKPRTWLPLVTLVFAIVIIVEIGHLQGDPDRDSTETLVSLSVALAVLAALALGFGLWRTYSRNKRRFTASIPAGSVIAIGFREQTITSRGPQGLGEVRYAVYQRVDVRGDFVFLRQRGLRYYGALPAQMFTPESLAWLRSKIAT